MKIPEEENAINEAIRESIEEGFERVEQASEMAELLDQVKKTVRFAMMEAAKDIIKSTNLNKIKERLFSLPADIRNQKLRITDVSQVAAERRLALLQEEAIISAVIATDIDPKTGKAIFSNQAARDAELTIRKKSSPIIAEMTQQHREAEAELAEQSHELEKLQDEFRAARILARIACTELALLGGEKLEEEDSDVY